MKIRNSQEPEAVLGARWIPLTKGLFALVDETDFDEVSRFTWTAMKMPRTCYAYFRRRVDGKHPTTLLHRMLTKAPAGMQVDHINGNGLDCRRLNMRICTVAENHRNIRKCNVLTSSRFKGVSWDRTRRKWFAKLKTNGKTENIGRFEKEEDAAQAYNIRATMRFGEFAHLNSL